MRNVPQGTTFQVSPGATSYRLALPSIGADATVVRVRSTPANDAQTGNAQFFAAVELLSGGNQQIGAANTSTDSDADADKKAEEEAAARKKKGAARP